MERLDCTLVEEKERIVARNREMQNADAFHCDACGKICKSSGGLFIHRKKIHGELYHAGSSTSYGASAMKDSKRECKSKPQEGMRCSGSLRAESANRRRCWKCGKERSKANIARNVRACTANETEGGVRGNVRPEEGLARANRPNNKACPNCGRTLSATNMARH